MGGVQQKKKKRKKARDIIQNTKEITAYIMPILLILIIKELILLSEQKTNQKLRK
jgi:hypothetical protein